jgi:hypothetical protein
MKILLHMIFGYLLITFLVTSFKVVEKTSECDAFCPQVQTLE